MLILEGFSFHKNKDTRIENMQVKKQQLEPDMEQLTGSNLGKEYDKAVYTENIVQNARLDESQAGIKNARRNIKTSDIQMIPPYGIKLRGTKEPLNEGERGE